MLVENRNNDYVRFSILIEFKQMRKKLVYIYTLLCESRPIFTLLGRLFIQIGSKNQSEFCSGQILEFRLRIFSCFYKEDNWISDE